MKIDGPSIRLSLLICGLTLLLGVEQVPGQTLISGAIQGVVGPEGNPYVVIDHCTIPIGQTLTVEPGVEITIGPGLSITAAGRLIAKGTSAHRISIKGAGPRERWSQILLDYSATGSEFTYCDFAQAQTALNLRVYNQHVLSVKVFNCTFNDCAEQGIYGSGQGYVHGNMSGVWPDEPTLEVEVRNCLFEACGNGCWFHSAGDVHVVTVARAYVRPTILNSIFRDIAGDALHCAKGSYPGSSPVVFRNNVTYNCGGGVFTEDPYDVQISNNIFFRTRTGVRRSGSLSSGLAYNCFGECSTNLVGYPASYGGPIMNNRNGHRCDVAFNIFEDPGFADTTSLRITAESACVDAGDGGWQYADVSPTASQGTRFADLGAWGGPDAANWLPIPPLERVTARMRHHQAAVLLEWVGVPRSRYRLHYADSVPVQAWLPTTHSVFLVGEALMSVEIPNELSRDVRVFTVESLGKSSRD